MGTHPGRRSILARAADIVWPPRSLLSDRIVDRPGAIEAPLWAELRFLARPLCAACGFPFETAAEDGALCGACTAEAPGFATARAALVYDDHARKLVLDLKRGGRRDGLKVFAGWMARAGAEALTEADLIAPTPLHWTRLLERRFNQSAWLAEAISRASGKPLAVDLLTRRRRRKSQEGLTASQRRRNVEGVFAMNPPAGRVAGRIVVLIDDVFTTGATAEACAKALLRAKAAKVHVLTLARVVRPVDVSI
ncbi:MAG: ComF family protein [Hyphomonadaceae bacterium]|nr:MAG: putative phosphoribosyl transferase [Caulobacteraceae bacterium]MBT9446383.1 ComF family protein [Hyphomonadaceae bacterium]TPW07876.1 MAG: putative phosphoribosyl transferase [Alphaproteobacteria bacterium]